MLRLTVPAARPGPWATFALGATLLLVLWSALSFVWADDRGAAWLGSERWALYGLAFALPVLWPPGRRELAVALGACPMLALLALVWGLAIALSGGGTLQDGPLIEPFGSPNALGAFFAPGALVSAMGAPRPTPAEGFRRGVWLASAGVL